MNQNTVKPSPWVAYRTYYTKNEVRSIIANEKDHEIITLDGLSALLWGRFEKGCTPEDLKSIAAEFDLEMDEINEFIQDLMAQNLLYDNSYNLNSIKAEPAPAVKRLEFASNTDVEYEMMNWVTDHGFLYSIQWEVTFRCNEACIHCYNPGAAHAEGEKNDRKRDELSTEEAKSLFDQLADLGVFRLILSGGEATLRKDFWELLEYARSKGFAVALYTNGLKAGEKFIDNLSKYWPTSVSISIYSALPEVHDKVTRVPGSFFKSISALQRINEIGIKTYLKSTQMSHTVESYQLIYDLAKSVGAGAEVDMHMSDGADGAKIASTLSVKDPRTLVVMALTPDSPLYIHTAEENFAQIKKDVDSTVCGAGVSFMYVDPEGNYSPCSSMPIGAKNLRDLPFVDYWKSSTIGRQGDWGFQQTEATEEQDLNWWQNIRLRDYHECGTHRRCGWCTKCPGLAYLQHGDVLAPSEVNCRLAGARMIAADLKAKGYSTKDLHDDVPIDFGKSSNINELPVIQEQPHELRTIGCSSGGCGSCSTFESNSETTQVYSGYQSSYDGLELEYGNSSIVQGLKELDDFIHSLNL